MKLNFFILLICCSAFYVQGFAQRKQNVYFLKNNGKRVNIRDSADFIRILSEPDASSELFNVEEFYKNNNLRFKGKSSRPDPITLEGEGVSYYPSGKKREIINYKDGKKVGDAYQYYPNGKLYTHRQYLPKPDNSGSGKIIIIDCADSTGKALVTNGNGYYIIYDKDFNNKFEEGPVKEGLRQGTWKGKDKDLKLSFTEEYNADTLVTGKSVDDQNVNYSYKTRNVLPQPVGGVQEFSKFLSRNIRYPNHAKENNIQGRVIITFVVEKDGSLVDYKVRSSPDDELSAESLRVLKLSPNWIPGIRYGKPVRVSYTVPIQFDQL